MPVTLATERLLPPCRFLADYWEGLRAGRLLPRRSDVDPARMIPILSRIYILEAHAPGDIRFRLTGTDYVRLLGFEATGRNLIELTPAEERRGRAWGIWRTAELPCAVWFTRLMSFASGRTDTAQSLMLPLDSDRPGAPRQLIAITVLSDAKSWEGRLNAPLMGPSLDFGFLDIGAGVPDAGDPPADWAADLPVLPARVDTASTGS